MKISTTIKAAAESLRRYERQVCDRLNISRRALALIGLAVLAVTAASTALAVVGEDVLGRNGLETHDASNLRLVTSHRSDSLVSGARYASQIGSIGLLIALAATVGLLLWRRGARLGVALTPLISLLVAGSMTAGVKQLVGRARPPLSFRLATETGKSFPSGHATDSAALFVALGIVIAAVVLHRPLARTLAVLAGFGVSALIGLSRLMLGVHWPTDVIAGWAVGTVVAITLSTTMLMLTRTNATSGESQSLVARAYSRTHKLIAATRHRAVIV